MVYSTQSVLWPKRDGIYLFGAIWMHYNSDIEWKRQLVKNRVWGQILRCRFSSPPGAIWWSFCNFPHTLGILGCMENCETFTKLHRVGWKNSNVKFVPRPVFWLIGVFTQYRCCSASKWPQTHQKWITTTLFRSRHTVGTLKHGLDSIFTVLSLFLASEVASRPGAPLDPLVPSWPRVCHPGL